jgi:simple sugar transport system ATP-binding protein
LWGGPFRRLDWSYMNAAAREELAEMGIDIRDPRQAVGTLSGGERQCLAIARAVHFGAKILILDEPTSALGVHQASVVLRIIARARTRGLGVVFITHNVHHAFPVADRFTLLNRGKSLGTFSKRDATLQSVTEMMAGGKELVDLEAELRAL